MDREHLPQAMQTAAHHVIHNVVFTRYRVEHVGDFRLFFLFSDRFIAKMRGTFW